MPLPAVTVERAQAPPTLSKGSSQLHLTVEDTEAQRQARLSREHPFSGGFLHAKKSSCGSLSTGFILNLAAFIGIRES